MKVKRVRMLCVTGVMMFAACLLVIYGAYAAGSESKGSESKGSESKGSESKAVESAATRCTIVGTVVVGTQQVDDKQVSIPYVKVLEAKDANGKSMDMMNGMALQITGEKAADAIALKGKQIEVTGVMAIAADVVVEKKAQPKGSSSR